MTEQTISPNRGDPFGFWGSYVITSADALTLADSACRGGARILQLREKSACRRELLEIARAIRGVTTQHGTLFIVNDYLDIALLADADGVHLGQDDIPIRYARRLAPAGFIVGVSTHSLEQAKAAEAEGADYIGIGPVFDTPTKPSSPSIGIETVRDVALAMNIPSVAIGGINLGNLHQLKEAGVTNVAMVRGFAQDTEETVRQVNRLLIGKG